MSDVVERSRGGRWRARLTALAIGLLLALVVAEVGYRLARSSSLGPTTNPAYVTYDAELGWAYRPGTVARHRSSEFDVEVRINRRGFRGEEWPSIEEGRERILVLGDSYTFGWGVEHEESFSSRLSELEPGWDVFNAAVSGFGTDQELLLLRRLVTEVEPSLVICFFCPNDLAECSGPTAYGRHKPWFELEGDRLASRGVPVPRPWLPRVSHLWRAFEKLRWEGAQAPRVEEHTEDWRLVQALYLEMKRELGEVPLLVMSEAPQLANLARRSELEHLDLRPLLAELGAGAHFPLDGHYTPRTHARLARALRERARPLLERESD